MKLLVVENDPTSPLGLMGEHFRAAGAEIQAVDPHRGGFLPDTVQDWSALVVLGGAQSANDDNGFPGFGPICGLIRDFHDAGLPVLGICLGAQLIARAFDAAVRPMGEIEVGLTPVGIRDPADPLLVGETTGPWVMQWHEDSFELPRGAALILDGVQCHHQAFRLGSRTWGFQGHIEVGATRSRSWIEEFRPWILARLGAEAGAARIEAARAEIDAHGAAAEAFGGRLAKRFLATTRS